MENVDDLELKQNSPMGTSPEVQEIVVKLWELIRGIVDEKESIRNQKDEIEKQFNHALKASDEYELKIDSYREELKRSSLQQEDIKSSIEELKKKNADLIEQLAILEGYDSKYHKLLIDFETLQQKSANIKSLELKVDELQLVIDEQDREIFSLNSKLQDDDKEKSDIRYAYEENARKNKELNEKSDEIIKLKDIIAGLENELLKLGEKESIPEEILRELKDKDSLLALANDKIELLEDELNSLEERHNLLIEEKTEEKTRQLEIWSVNENNLASMNQEIGNLKMNLKEAIDENEKLRLALEEINLAYELKNSEYNSLSEELSGLRSMTEESTLNTEEYILEISKLNERISDSDQIVRLLRDKIDEQQELILSQQSSLIADSNSIDQLNEKIADFATEVEMHRENIKANEILIQEKENELDILRRQYEESSENIPDFDKFHEKLTEIEALKIKVADYESSEIEYQAERDEFKSKIEILATKLDSIENNIEYVSKLESEIDDLKMLNENLINEMKNLQSHEQFESELFEENRDLGKILLAKEKELSEAMTNLRLAESKNIKEAANVERLNIRIIELEGIIASMKVERENFDLVKGNLVTKIENQIRILDEAIRKP